MQVLISDGRAYYIVNGIVIFVLMYAYMHINQKAEFMPDFMSDF